MIKINLKKSEKNQPTKGLFFGEVVIDNKPTPENSDVSILLTEQEVLDLQSVINAIVKNNNLGGKQNSLSGLIDESEQMINGIIQDADEIIKDKFYKIKDIGLKSKEKIIEVLKSNEKDVKTDGNESQNQKET